MNQRSRAGTETGYAVKTRQNAAPFASSADVFAWLERFIVPPQGQAALRPERMRALADAAGCPERSAPSVHVAGTKGKGSVTGMASSILSAAGYRAARYVSPHVTEYRERITVDGAFFSEAVYAAAGNELRAAAEAVSARANPARRLFQGEPPSFFELLTLYFFLCAREGGCNALAVETGMGGRLDPTNIVEPLAAAITGIELEHTEFLGGTIAAIAAEKAGIIKAGKPVVIAEQPGDALAVFRAAAAEKGAPLCYLPDAAAVENLRLSRNGTDFTLRYTDGSSFGRASAPPLALFITIPGEIQALNAALAVLAVRKAFPEVGDEAVRRGLAAFRIPARFERVSDDPPVIVDGAHTEASAGWCARTFAALYGEGGILLFGCAAGKNAGAMARTLLGHFSRIVITAPGSGTASRPERVREAFEQARREAGGRPPQIEFVPDTAPAIRRALDAGRAAGLPVLGTGSFYLAAEIRKLGKEA